MPRTPLSSDSRINALLSTYQWGTSNGSGVNLSYSFPTNGSTWLSNYGQGEPFSPYSVAYLTTNQKTDVTAAFMQWDAVANINLTQVSEPNSQGDIRFTYSTIVTGSTTAYAYIPTSSSTSFVNDSDGDVWINFNTTDFSEGTYGYSTIIHETGHALGLKHPFETEFNNSTVLTGTQNSTQYTVMSYTDYDGVGYYPLNNNQYSQVQPTTPMLYDILAIQFLYGPNTSYANGNNTYTFSTDIPDFMTIWDTGGTDTFDLSNQTQGATVNLNAGEFSSIGTIQYKLVNGFIQTTEEPAVDNIAIAYDVAIENVLGGSGSDVITGNALANIITGNGGNDQINGGGGNDTAVYTGNKSAYDIQVNTNNIQISSLSSNEGVDTLTGIEQVQFADQLWVVGSSTPITPTPPTQPSEVDLTPAEGDSNHINYFLLQISEALSTDASVNYTTRDGTAKAGEDYIATSGIATIKAGETHTVIGVEIIGDNVLEADETFFMAVTNPKGGIFPNNVTELTAMHTIMDDDGVTAGRPALDIMGIAPLEYA